MQVIKILCDWCYSEDREETAEREVPLMVGGKSVVADLCPAHRSTLESAPVIVKMLEIGRRPDKLSTPVTPKPKRAPVAPVEPDSKGEYPCDLCERSFSKPQGLGRHKLSVHDVPGAARSPIAIPA